jgi:hypothetical protein
MRTPKELFNEIVKLASTVGQEPEVAKEVSISEVELVEDVADETPVADVVPTEEPSNEYITRSEFESALNELKEMYAKVLEVVSPSAPEDVPADLSSDLAEVADEAEVAVDLSSDEPSDDLIHAPGAEVKEKSLHLYSQGRAMTTEDHVFNSIFKK